MNDELLRQLVDLQRRVERLESIETASFPAFAVEKNVDQINVQPTTFTKISWQVEQIDTGGMFANDRFTPTIAGVYLLSASLTMYLNPGTLMYCSIYKNGVRHRDGFGVAASNQLAIVRVVAPVSANGTGDYFEVYCYHTDSAAKHVVSTANSTFFAGYRGTSL